MEKQNNPETKVSISRREFLRRGAAAVLAAVAGGALGADKVLATGGKPDREKSVGEFKKKFLKNFNVSIVMGAEKNDSLKREIEEEVKPNFEKALDELFSDPNFLPKINQAIKSQAEPKIDVYFTDDRTGEVTVEASLNVPGVEKKIYSRDFIHKRLNNENLVLKFNSLLIDVFNNIKIVK